LDEKTLGVCAGTRVADWLILMVRGIP
jgi:hypothetical protein